MNQVATLNEYIALIRKHIRTPANAINESELYEWCYQTWNNRHSSGYSEATVIKYARKFDREVLASCTIDPNGRTDRKRKTSTRLS